MEVFVTRHLPEWRIRGSCETGLRGCHALVIRGVAGAGVQRDFDYFYRSTKNPCCRSLGSTVKFVIIQLSRLCLLDRPPRFVEALHGKKADGEIFV
jgi:hypothetical protein